MPLAQLIALVEFGPLTPNSIAMLQLAAPPSEEKANLTSEQIAAFKAQVRKCWVAPSGTPDANIVMRIALNPDGMLGAVPELIAAPLEVDGRPLRDSAKRALQKCQPYAGLPSDKYKDWKILDLAFTAQGPAGLSEPSRWEHRDVDAVFHARGLLARAAYRA